MPKLVIALIYPAAVGLVEWFTSSSYLLFGIHLIMSAITFVVYAIDKFAAVKGRWRIPEAHLHLLALLGGWPGAMIAQQLLRHKTMKRAFRIIFRLTLILNCAGTVWLLSPAGAPYLKVLNEQVMQSE